MAEKAYVLEYRQPDIEIRYFAVNKEGRSLGHIATKLGDLEQILENRQLSVETRLPRDVLEKAREHNFPPSRIYPLTSSKTGQ